MGVFLFPTFLYTKGIMLKLYNTFTRKKEEFTPIKKGQVGMYACGPTVYWYAHIGNMRSFLFSDVLHRTLEYNGLPTKLIMNITDVGHLTGDADEGEDKMIVAMKKEGKSAKEIAEFYTESFMKDVDALNIESADEYPRATAHIEEQIDLVKKLETNGFTYTTSDGVYFDTSKYPEYGQLSGQKAEDKKAGARIELGEKKNPTDFALWKLSPESSSREMEWESPWGKGFPGWHLECSAMSTKYLGIPFDIHTGGIDHVPVHHENEIAQSVGGYGAMQSRFWIHNEFLTVENGKMAKSLGNVYTISDLTEKGFNPLAFRYFTLGAHYRTKLNFTFEALEASQNALFKLQDVVRDWDKSSEESTEFNEKFLNAINDDLNTAQALAVVWELVDSDLETSTKSATLLKFDEVLGLNLNDFVSKPIDIPEEVTKLMNERETARKEKNWEESDRLREKLEKLGFTVEDSGGESKIKQLRK
jgi:cysteinyl-tRNA synthetase